MKKLFKKHTNSKTKKQSSDSVFNILKKIVKDSKLLKQNKTKQNKVEKSTIKYLKESDNYVDNLITSILILGDVSFNIEDNVFDKFQLLSSTEHKNFLKKILKENHFHNEINQKLYLEKKNYIKSKKIEMLKNNIYYNFYEDFLEDWDITMTKKLEEDFYIIQNPKKLNEIRKEIEYEDLLKIKENSILYSTLKENKLIMGVGKRAWNNGLITVGTALPNANIISLDYDFITYLSPSIIEEEYSYKNKIKIIDRQTNIVSTDKLYAFIVSKGFSDLIIYQYNSNTWAMWGIKDGNRILIGNDVLNLEEAELLVKALLFDMQENSNNQEFFLTGTVNMKSFKKIKDIELNDIPIGEKTFRIDMMRQYKSSSKRGSSRFARTINIRVLETGSSLRELTKIGYYPEDLEIIELALRNGKEVNNGGIIYAGAPSSGKSTALYSLFANLHKIYNAQVVTIDGAVEFEYHGFRQISTDDVKNAKKDKQVNFSDIINNLLKQYADAILLGEVRNDEQIKQFVHGIERGRLMAGTMHTNDTKSIFTVLNNTGLQPYQYLPSLKLLVYHELVPNICTKCKGELELEEDNGSMIICPSCHGSGSNGRELVYEIAYLVPGKIDLGSNPALEFDKLVKEGSILFKSKQSVAQKKYEEGKISKNILDVIVGKNLESIKERI